MFARVGEWGADLTGAWSLPAWAVILTVAVALLVYALPSMRRGTHGERGSALRFALIVVAAAIAWWIADHSARRDTAAERQALDARASELTARAFLPGSPLACLAGPVGEMIEDACEKSIFASAEATATAVSYVAAQLSLLADARDHARRSGANYGNALTNLRRVLEADRFGIVAHVLAVRDGCTADQCAAFAFLQGTGRVSANLAQRPFEAHLKEHMAGWQTAGSRPVANNPPAAATAPVAAAKSPSSVYFPSSASIPPVNIMAAEPPASPPGRDAAGAGDPASPLRRPSSSAPGARQPSNPNSGTTGAGPLQLVPGAQ